MSFDQASPNELAAIRDAVDRALRAKDQSGKAGIAAAILRDGIVIGRGENEVRLQSDPTKLAEMVALTAAAHALGHSDLSGCVMISTLQPCEMCLAAMRFAGIERVILAWTSTTLYRCPKLQRSERAPASLITRCWRSARYLPFMLNGSDT